MRRGRKGRGQPLEWFDPTWHRFAACRGLGDRDDVWFALPRGVPTSTPAARPEIARALQLCRQSCPVLTQCWRQAAADPYAEGVWGGEYWPSWTTQRETIIARGPHRPVDTMGSGK